MKRQDAETDELDEPVAKDLELEIDVIVRYTIDFGGDQGRVSKLFNYIRANFCFFNAPSHEGLKTVETLT